jgi:hypothetical protein
MLLGLVGARRAAAAAARAPLARAPLAPLARQQARQMGGHGGHGHVEYHGAMKTIRKYLPEDHHIVLANMASWVVLYGLYKVTQIGKKPAKIKKEKEAPAASSGDVPSVIDDNFSSWIAQPGNEERYTASLEGWAKSL